MQSTDEQGLRELNIYTQYQDIIAGFIAELEVRDVEYPIEIFNEIRSIFTHLSRYKIQNKNKDLYAAERHIKRAILDCFKYMCISYAEEVKNFRNSYKKVDLKIADNGKFLPRLDELDNVARKSYLCAKKAEIKGDISEDQLYDLYQKAFNDYSAVSMHIEESSEAILFASCHSKRTNRVTIISIIITLISIFLAILPYIT